MADKKVFTIQIDGIEKSYNDVVKLSEALDTINSVNATVTATNKQVAESQTEIAAVATEVSKAQSDYEKIQARIADLEKESTKINIEANQQLKERRSEITAQVQANTAQEGSIKQMQAQLKLLRGEYDKLSAAERNNVDVGGELLHQIQELDAAHKAAKEATGRHQESVGNYENATRNLKQELREMQDQLAEMLINGVQPTDEAFIKLSTQAGELRDAIGDATRAVNLFASDSRGLDQVISVGKGITGVFGTATGVMSMFGQSGEDVGAAMEKMMGVMTTLQSLQALQNTLTEKGTLVNTLYTKVLQALGITKKSNIADNTALSASTNATTVATTGASTAMKVLRMALISTGVGALVVGLGMLIAHFDDIKKWVVDLVPALGDMGGAFNELKAIFMGVGKAAVDFLLTPIKTVVAVIKGFIDDGIKGAVKAGTEEFKKGINVIDNYEKGYQKQSVANAKAAAKEKAKIRAGELENTIKNNEAKYGSDWKYSEEGRKAYQALYDAKKIMYADDKAAMQDLQREEWKHIADITKHDKDELKKRSDAAKSAADKRKQILDDYKKSLESFRNETHQLELQNEQLRVDSAKTSAEKMVATTKDELTKRNDAITEAYGKQLILQQKLNSDEITNVEKQYNELIEKAKKAGEDTEAIENEKQNRLYELQSKFSSIEIALVTEKNEKIKSSNKLFDDEELKRQDKVREQTRERITDETKLINNQYKTIKDLKEDVVSRSGSLNLIDVKETTKNLKTVEGELKNYLSNLEKSKAQIETYYDDLIKTYKVDSKEYKAAVEAKKAATDDINNKIKITNKDIADNTQQQTQVMTDYWEDFSAKVGGYISVISDSIGTIFDTVGSFFSMKLEEAQEKLDEITEKYEDTVKLQQESNERLLALNEEAKTAAGGRALVVQDEIQREMAYNKELANQEKQLAKEKEKREKELAKAEKQQKKADLMGNIVSGISGTALAVINALTVKPFPLGVALAAVAGTMGAVQVGIMSSQLSKLEDGGLIRGKSHSQGGARIEGTNIEVEGNEFVTNKRTTMKNLPLLHYINSQDKELGVGDFINYYNDSTIKIVPNYSFKQMFADGGQISDLSNVSAPTSGNDDILNAIQGINFSPVVAVQDINDVNQQLTSVRDSAGFS